MTWVAPQLATVVVVEDVEVTVATTLVVVNDVKTSVVVVTSVSVVLPVVDEVTVNVAMLVGAVLVDATTTVEGAIFKQEQTCDAIRDGSPLS